MPDDHSEVVPLLPIPNRKVKRLCADDSADSRVKVGHRQAIKPETPTQTSGRFFCLIISRPAVRGAEPYLHSTLAVRRETQCTWGVCSQSDYVGNTWQHLLLTDAGRP